MAQKKEYTPSQAVTEAAQAVKTQAASKPEYTSAYESALNDTMEKILSQKDFSYRLDGDALYRQYKNQAVNNGRLAMQDAMGQAAALTGGYGNSYAQSVGQQAYAQELDSLSEKIPELYNLAMEQYKLKSQTLQDKYSTLANAEDSAYSRYSSSLSAWQKEAEQLWEQYADTAESDYDAYRDEIADWQWQQERDESKRRYDQEWEAEHPTVQSVQTASSGSAKKQSDTSDKEDTGKSSGLSSAAQLLATLAGVAAGWKVLKKNKS